MADGAPPDVRGHTGDAADSSIAHTADAGDRSDDHAAATHSAATALAAAPLARFYRSRRVLVTGSSGLLGHWIMALLVACGARAAGLSRRPPADGLAYPTYPADVRDARALDVVVEMVRPSVIVHLAAQAHTRRTETRRTYETNIVGTMNTLEAAAAHQVPACVIASSSRDPATTVTDLAFYDAYNASKLATEQVASGYRADALRSQPLRGVAIARPAVLVGGGDLTPGRLVPDVMAELRAGRTPRLASPTQYRPWQHAVEAAAGVLWLGARLVEAPDRTAPAVNFGLGEAVPRVSVGWVAAALVALWRHGEPEQAPGPAPAEGFWLDDTSARAVLGWTACWSLHQALAATVAWHRAHQRGPEVAHAETSAQLARYVADAAAAGMAWAASGSSGTAPVAGPTAGGLG